MTGPKIKPADLAVEDYPKADVAFLSPLEREVLKLVEQGSWYKDIPEKVGVGHKRLQKIMAHIYAATNASNRLELIIYAKANGIGNAEWIAWDERSYAIAIQEKSDD